MSESLTYAKTTEIPLKNLVLSTLNMRAGKTIDADFVNSIKNNGVVQALLVIKCEDDDIHEVVAGRRRYLALKSLEKKGAIDSDVLVPCSVTTEAKARTASIVENLHRQIPHRSEIHTAINKLAEDGKTKKDICSSINISSIEYEQTIRLANLHPRIYKAYAGGKLTDSQAQAFAATDDAKKQISIWKQSDFDTNISPFQIKKMIATGITSNDTAVRYIGMKAYKDAGGSSVHDLFEDTYHLNDADLVKDLVRKKLQKDIIIFKEAEPSWKWTTVYVPNFYGDEIKIQHRLHPKRRKKTPEQLAQLRKLQTKIDDLQKIEEERTLTEDEESSWDAIQDSLYNEQERINSENEYYTKKEMANAGVIASINNNGILTFDKGLQTKEDVKSTAASTKNKQSSDAAPAIESPVYSQVLKADAINIVTSALQAHLLNSADLACDLLNYSIAYRALSLRYASIPHDIRPETPNLDTSLEDYESSIMCESMKKAYDALDLKWIEIESDKERQQSFISLPDSEKKNIMAYVSAVTLASDADGYIRSKTAMNLREFWEPNETNYFRRVSKDKLIEHAAELNVDPGDSVSTKKAMVNFISELFANTKDKTIGQWLPPLFR